MRTIYFELSSGISGDMAAAALMDLGVSPLYLINELKKLNIGGYEVIVKKDTKQGISGLRMDVLAEETDKARHLSDILKIIDASSLNADVKNMSKEIFLILAEAEAKVHDIDIEKVHFHEVGAIDSIIDITAVSICVDHLRPDRIVSSSVRTGKGHVKCSHGILPVPAPAVAEILKGIPIYSGDSEGEMTTPTGAAVIKRLAQKFEDINDLNVTGIGYGIGKKDFAHANVLRVLMSEDEYIDRTFVIETNIDDMVPELYESVFTELFDKGALDVCMHPVIMKKQRPGIVLSVLCQEKYLKELELALLKDTTTFGVRSYEVKRNILDRKTEVMDTRYGQIRVKRGYLDGVVIKEKLEYEDIKRVSLETGRSIIDIMRSLNGDGVYHG
jgi:pyridinium-3,5-bisthiocarboxylic acid mononucleotide nickel chelatase